MDPLATSDPLPSSHCACWGEQALLRLSSLGFCVITLSLLVVGTYHHADVGQLGWTISLDPLPALQELWPRSVEQHEEEVAAASWLPESIPYCLHRVFAKHAPQRPPTPLEHRVAGIDHIYVIHWTPLTERLTTMSARFDRVLRPGWADQNYVTFVNQFDSQTITDADALCLAGPRHRNLKNGTLSVTTKHHLAYYDALVNNYGVIMLLEDDTDFVAEFETLTTAIVAELVTKESWGNCMISGGYGPDVAVAPYIFDSPPGEGSRCAYGYLVSPLGSTQILSNIPIRDNPDWQMNFAVRENGMKSYMTMGCPVFEVADDKDGSWMASR